MAEDSIDTWIIHSLRKVLATDQPGVPTAVTFVINPEDYARNGPTLGNLGFDKNVYKLFTDWDEARKYAEAKAAELGYEVEYDNWWGREMEAEENGDWDDYDEGWD